MNELSNISTAVGDYNNIATSITSTASVVQMISGLTITKTADKQMWADGPLTYTITISNQAAEDYETPVITDVIDTTLVTFIPDSVYINNVKATSTEYNYDTGTHTLTVNLVTITPTSSTTVTFQVDKA